MTTLADAGADLSDDEPDVELSSTWPVGDAPTAVISLYGDRLAAHDGRPPLIRATRRVMRSTLTVTRARLRARALRGHSYRTVELVTWDIGQRIESGHQRARSGGSLVERFPLGALVVGRREEHQTVLERVVATAEALTGSSFRGARPYAAAWGVRLLGDHAVLRVTIGPSRRRLQRAAETLEQLKALDSPELRGRVPRPLVRRDSGLAVWLVEERLHGDPMRPRLTPQLRAELVDFLAALHAGGNGDSRSSPSADAAVLATVCGPEDAAAVLRLGERLEALLADVPRGFAHGDLTPANLLEADGHLSGVVDWMKAGAGRPPLFDLANLLLTSVPQVRRRAPADALRDYLLPLVRSGTDESVRAYCAAVGLDPSPELLQALVAAYWLDRQAGQLRSFTDRAQRPRWIDENILLPLRALTVKR